MICIDGSSNILATPTKHIHIYVQAYKSHKLLPNTTNTHNTHTQIQGTEDVYGVATISRLLNIIGLFAEYRSLL